MCTVVKHFIGCSIKVYILGTTHYTCKDCRCFSNGASLMDASVRLVFMFNRKQPISTVKVCFR